MPGIDFKLTAMFISNIKNIDRFDSADKLAHYAGIAPTEYSSDKS
ncbi:MAG: transposase [bacterium]